MQPPVGEYFTLKVDKRTRTDKKKVGEHQLTEVNVPALCTVTTDYAKFVCKFIQYRRAINPFYQKLTCTSNILNQFGRTTKTRRRQSGTQQDNKPNYFDYVGL